MFEEWQHIFKPINGLTVISHIYDEKYWAAHAPLMWWLFVNPLRPRQDGRHFADDIFTCIFLNENVWIPIKISLKFVPKGPINNIPALVQIMAWRHPGDKPLSEPMMVSLPKHICVARPQWVKWQAAWWLPREVLISLVWIHTGTKGTLHFNDLVSSLFELPNWWFHVDNGNFYSYPVDKAISLHWIISVAWLTLRFYGKIKQANNVFPHALSRGAHLISFSNTWLHCYWNLLALDFQMSCEDCLDYFYVPSNDH